MVNIVPAEERDVPALCRLWLEFMDYSAGVDDYFAMRERTSAGFERDYLRPAMTSEQSRVFVAKDAGDLLGYVHVDILQVPNLSLPQVGEVEHLFVTGDRRREGIGGRLYREAIAWLRSRNIGRVQVQIITRNPIAVSFWKKQGYTGFMETLYRTI